MNGINHKVMIHNVRALLRYLGEDVNREGLIGTPERFIKALEFWTQGYGQDPEAVLKTFEDGAEQYDEMVLQKDIPVWSLCEHHLAPFFGIAHVAYIPDKRVVGLSKLARLVDIWSRRLQVQERLTCQIAHSLYANLEPLGVGVVLKCRHTCIESRGVQKAGTVTETSSLFGVFKKDQKVRDEFMHLMKD